MLWPIWKPKVLFSFLCRAKNKMACSKGFTLFYMRRKKNGQREIQEATGNQTKKSFYPPQQTCPFCWYSLWKHSRQLTGLSGGPFLRDGSSFQGCTCSGEQQSLINLGLVYHASMETVWAFHWSFLVPQRTHTRLSTTDAVFLAI